MVAQKTDVVVFQLMFWRKINNRGTSFLIRFGIPRCPEPQPIKPRIL